MFGQGIFLSGTETSENFEKWLTAVLAGYELCTCARNKERPQCTTMASNKFIPARFMKLFL